MTFFLRKRLKAPIALLVCFVLVLQMLPAPQPAQAGFWDTVKKIISRISLPNEVELNDQGKIIIGNWLQEDDEFNKPIGISPVFDWLFKDIEPVGGWEGHRNIVERWINPFSKVKIGGDSSKKLLFEPALIPGCVEETVQQNISPGCDPNATMPNDATYEKVDPVFITKKITGCTAVPCLESEEICSSKDYKEYANVNDRVSCDKRMDYCDANSTCYEWYMGNPKYSNEKNSVINKDNPTWRLYWEYHLGETLGTFENIKKARDYYVSDANKSGAVAILEGALKNLSGHTSFNDAYNETNPKYKNLRAYASVNIEADPFCPTWLANCPDVSKSKMEKTHEYYIKTMSAMMPSLRGLASLDNITLNWWGDDAAGKNSARIKIKSALAILKAGTAKDLTIINLDPTQLNRLIGCETQVKASIKTPSKCVNPNAGKPTIAQPVIPEECELRIKRPGDENDCSTKETNGERQACEEELIAHRAACTQFIRLQRAATEEVWIAKKIFNSTNPYDDCFFLANCRSKCYLSYGELRYVITWLDIAQFLLPTSWITVIKKIMGVMAALKEIEKAYTALKVLLTDGIALINNFFETFHYLTNMFAALDNIGGTMSAAIGVAGVAVSGLESAGVLQIPGNAMQYGAAVGAAAVLTSNKGINSMTDMLKRFSDNLLRYSTAKSETNAYILGIRRDLTAILEGDSNVPSKGAKHEQELSYFFESNSEVRKSLDQIVGNFQVSFKQLSTLLDNAVGPGQLPGELVTGMVTGTGEEWNVFKDESLNKNEAPVFDFKSWENKSNGVTSVYVSDTIFGDRNIRDKKDFCSNDYEENDQRICMFQGDRVSPWEKAVCPPDTLLIEANEELRKLTEPDYVKYVLKQALGEKKDGKDCISEDRYCMDRLRDGDDWKQLWVDYWIKLRNVTLGPDNRYTKPDQIQIEVLKTRQTNKNGEQIQLYGFLNPLAKLDDENGEGTQNKDNGIGNYSKPGALSNTEKYINYNYAILRFNSFIFSNSPFCEPEKLYDNKTLTYITWLDNFKTIFQGASTLQANFKLVDPNEIEKMLIGENTSIMVCAGQKGACKLDHSVQEWREYWENLARQLMSKSEWAAMKKINEQQKLNMQETHNKMMEEVLNRTGKPSNSLLAYIARIQRGTYSYEDLRRARDNDKVFLGISGNNYDSGRDRGYYNEHCDITKNPVDDGAKDDDIGTYCFIKRRIEEYRAARDTVRKSGGTVSNGYAVAANVAISNILQYVNALSYQKDYLESVQRHDTSEGERSRHFKGGSDYWQSQLWCAGSCQVPALPSELAKLQTLATPSYVKQVLKNALGVDAACTAGDTSDNCKKYKMKELDASKGAWLQYWKDLAQALSITSQWNNLSDLESLVVSNHDFAGLLSRLDDESGAGWQNIKWTDKIGNFDNYSSLGALTNTEYYIDKVYTPTWDQYNIQRIDTTEEGTAKVNFTKSYDPSIVYYDWDRRVATMADSAGNLRAVGEALSWGMTPQDPIIIYSIEQVKKGLDNLTATSTDLSGVTKAALDQVIDGAIEMLNCPQYRNAYDNFEECCSSEATNVATDQSCCQKPGKCTGAIDITDWNFGASCAAGKCMGPTWAYNDPSTWACNVQKKTDCASGYDSANSAVNGYQYWLGQCNTCLNTTCACDLCPTCGDGKVGQGEECDDGNNSYLDACLNNCKKAACGDGYTWNTAGGTEECDDGNASNGDGCSSLCKIEAGVIKYGCSICMPPKTCSTECIPIANGMFSDKQACLDSGCGGMPPVIPMYKCFWGACLPDPMGTYTSSNCNNVCVGPVQMYKCSNATGLCVPDAGGTYTFPDCDNACAAPVIQKYKCSPTTGVCVRDDVNGTYLTTDCNNSCPNIGNPRYRCSQTTGACIRDDLNGTYLWSDCDNKCVSIVTPLYKCSTTGTCVRDDVYGNFTTPNCNNLCVPTGPKYKCSGNVCVQDPNGPWQYPDCNNSCGVNQTYPKYKCVGSSCMRDDVNGTYIFSDCSGACQSQVVLKYKCSGSSCVQDPSGTYTSSNCNNMCVVAPPPETCVTCPPSPSSNNMTSYCHPICGYNCWYTMAECQQDLPTGKSASPFAVNIIDNAKQKIKNFAKSLFAIPEISAAALKPYCYPDCSVGSSCSESSSVCRSNCLSNVCNVANGPCDKKDQYKKRAECFQAKKDVYQKGHDNYVTCKKQEEFLDSLRSGSLKEALKKIADELKANVNALNAPFSTASLNQYGIVIANVDMFIKVGIAKSPFFALQDIWNESPKVGATSTQDVQSAKDYVDQIVRSKAVGRGIVETKLPSIKAGWNTLESFKIQMELLIDSPTNKVKLPQTIIDYLKTELIGKIDIISTKIKQDIIDKITQGIGEYKNPSNINVRSQICPDNTAALGFLNRIACFEWCGGLTYETCIKPDIKIDVNFQTKKFEELQLPLSAIQNVEESLFLLTEAKKEINTVSSIQESVDNLKPEIRSEAIMLNTNLIDDIENKVTGSIKNLFKKYNPEKEGGVDSDAANSKIQIFSGDGSVSFKDFAQSLTNSPLAFLKDQFDNIGGKIISIKTKLSDANNWLPAFFGGDRAAQYQTSVNNIRDIKMNKLGVMVSGNDEIRPACSALGILLNGDLTTMDKTCDQKSAGGELDSAWLASHISQETQCDSWLDLGADIANLAEVQKQKTALENLRNCVGVNCIKCPTWFCTDPATGLWGVGAMQNDPYCVKKCVCIPPDCKKWQPNQNTGYVCDSTNNIIWETADFGPVSNNPTQAICDDLGLSFLNFADCTKGNVNTRCQLINDFLKSSDCNLFDTCSKAELQRQLDIKTWRDQSAANKCPKWLCLNESGLWGPLASQTICEKNPDDPACKEDIYCKQIRNGGPFTGDNQANFDKPGDGFYYRNRIIWDTATNPTVGSQVWNGTAAINAKCAEVQSGLKLLGFSPLDPPPPAALCSPVDPIISFCQHRIACNAMKNACASWATQQQKSSLSNPLMEWPPTKPPLSGGFTQGYQGAKEICIQTQRQMALLNSVETATPEELNLMKLTDTCAELTRQKQLKADCERYTLTRCAIQDKCGSSNSCNIVICNNSDCTDKTTCNSIRTNMSSICTVEDANGNKAFRDGKYCSWLNKIKDIISVSNNSDTTKSNAEAMNKLRRLCVESNDIATPLNEVMKVLSVLMGIQSGTAAQGGITSSIKGAQAFYTNAGKFIKMIQGLKEAMGKAYESEMKKSAASSGGLKITPFKCIAAPAESYAGNKKQPLTGAKGGPVCPDVAGLYSQLQAQFSQIRQQLNAIENAYHKNTDVIIPLPWDKAFIKLGEIYNKTYDSIEPMFTRAEQLKQSAQFVWALATALNFASENCTCGMSYCKIPFCISGLPLTLAPLKDPYCALVWMLRTPMVNMAERLEKDLNKPLR